MSRRATLIDDDDRSRPSIPLRFTSSSSFMDTPSKHSMMDDDSSDFRSQVRAVSLRNEQHYLKSRLSDTSNEVDQDSSDGYLAESEDGVDETSGEVVISVDAIRENDDTSADITSVGESQVADASMQSHSESDNMKQDIQINIVPPEESESDHSIKSGQAATSVSAFHETTVEVLPQEPDLEVQLKESHDDTQQSTDRTSKDEIVVDDEGIEVDHQLIDGNRQSETNGNRAKSGGLSKRTWILLALFFIILVAGLGAAIGSMIDGTTSSAVTNGLSSPTQSPVNSPDASPSQPTMCTFCYDGTVPQNLGNSTIRNTSCNDFYNQLTGLFSTDPLCHTGQALAWRFCGCRDLPPAPVPATCTLCPNGTATTNSSKYCKDLSTLVAIVGSSRLSNCNDLRLQALQTCSCANDAIRKKAFQSLLSTVPGLNNSGNKASWHRAALNWISNEDAARIPPDRSRLKEIEERYVAALLFYAMGGSQWHNSANFMSQTSVCRWNNYGIGLFCNNALELEIITLSSNNLKGVIPNEISILTGLVTIALDSNKLSGPLPSSLEALRRLVTLQFQNNALTSTIPSSIFDSSSVQEIVVSNNLLQGSLPANLGNASHLHSFLAHSNLLTGPLPVSLQNLSTLTILDLHNNLLSGTLPQLDISLPLVDVNLGRNSFTGSIPVTLTSAPGLRALRLAQLNLTGPLPDFSSNNGSLVLVELFGNRLTGDLGEFLSKTPSSIVSLQIHRNFISGEIPTAIGRLTNLNELNLYQNMLNGTIPTEIGLLTQLNSMLKLNGNSNLSGTLPTELGLLINLNDGLYIYATAIHGTIPTELGRLTRLRNIALASNRFTGSIPSELGNLSLLRRLSVSHSFLTGELGSLFSFLPVSLILLRMDANMLNGTISSSIGAFSNLTCLTMKLNQISGRLPTEIGLLSNLKPIFDVHGNAITGPLPSEIGKLSNLELLDLGNNQFSSTLPSELGLLTSLAGVDLSQNILTGSMPATFAMLPRLNALLIFDNNITDVDRIACARLANLSFFVANSCNGSKVACKCCTNCCIEGSSHCPAVHKSP